MDPHDILRRGRTAAVEGRHEAALRDFVWFHEHALKYDKALYGVRLSFAIGYWKELADVYVPARDAFDGARGRAEALLLDGKGGRLEFNEVVAFDRELGRPANTHRLFARLARERPEVAKQCADLALEAVTESGDFELASRFLPHPETYLLWLSERLNADLYRARGAPPALAKRRREAYVRNFCSDVTTVIKILYGLGNGDAAEAAQDWAIALVETRRDRATVGAEMLRALESIP